MDLEKFSYNYYPILKEKTIENFMNSNYVYDQWEQVINMLHDFRKDIDYITFTNDLSYRTKIAAWKNLKKITYQYLKFKYSCNPLISRDSKNKCKFMLLKYLTDNPNFGYTRGIQIMRYVPYSERRRRPRTNPPPPPPILITSLSNDSSGNINIPPPPPVALQIPNVTPPSLPPPTPLSQIANPFTPTRELPRTPGTNNIQQRRQVFSNTLSLFRR